MIPMTRRQFLKGLSFTAAFALLPGLWRTNRHGLDYHVESGTYLVSWGTTLTSSDPLVTTQLMVDGKPVTGQSTYSRHTPGQRQQGGQWIVEGPADISLRATSSNVEYHARIIELGPNDHGIWYMKLGDREALT